MIYGIDIEPAARRDLQQLDPTTQKRVGKRIDGLARHPLAFGTEELTGELAGLRKLRVGDYRVVYTVDDDRAMVTIWGVGHRRHIYDMMRRRARSR